MQAYTQVSVVISACAISCKYAIYPNRPKVKSNSFYMSYKLFLICSLGELVQINRN